ncbi:MAG TPA: type II toxin-antitoxin system RelE/ParE family toxin [Candidatus Sulfomarinibacteraceae bacterium]|nr:type II toxin-antitoxin system RelE/ParE family toxin [Candidatus Sulfomarinibacteraceae bacterium]
MDFEFANRKLERLYTEEHGAKRYPPAVVDAFFEVMAVIAGARDERDLRALKQLHFEKLKGKRKHQRSLALHGGFRLVVQLAGGADGIYVLIEAIEDYHKG